MGKVSISKLCQELDDYGESWFKDKYSHPFLVVLSGLDSKSKNNEQLNSVKTSDSQEFSESVLQVRQQHLKKTFQSFRVKKTKNSKTENNVGIGRTRDNDIVLSHTSISRQHCTIVETENGFAVVDCGSSNGTFLNGTKLTTNQEMEIHNGDFLKVGTCVLKFFTEKGIIEFMRK